MDSLSSEWEGDPYGDLRHRARRSFHPSPDGRRERGRRKPGFFDRQEIGYGRRPWSETKPFFLTSEFLTLAGVIAAIAIAMAVLDNFNANRGWLLITIIGAAYMIARGLAKSGTRDPNPRDYR